MSLNRSASSRVAFEPRMPSVFQRAGCRRRALWIAAGSRELHTNRSSQPGSLEQATEPQARLHVWVICHSETADRVPDSHDSEIRRNRIKLL